MGAVEDRAMGEAIIDKMSKGIAKLMYDQGHDAEEIGRIARMGAHQQAAKLRDADGVDELVVTDLFNFSLSPKWEDGPEWPVVQPADPVKVKVSSIPKAPSAVCDVTLPDMQIGFWRDQHGQLQPIHCEASLAVSIEVCRRLQPRKVALHGDNLDLPNFGKYRKSPAFAGTTQDAINAMHAFLAKLRAACPESEIIWIAGNHDERLANWIIDNAIAAHGLREANRPDDWPVLSIPKLCRLDDLNIRFLPGYPAAHVWLADNLMVVHGHLVNSRGSTAAKYVDQHKVSIIYGHTHRIERLHHTRIDFDGPKEIMAASPGCLCRTDGAVPSTKGATDLDGRPLVGAIAENWQNGVGVVWHHGDTWHYDQAWIEDGVGYLGREAISA